MRTALAGIVAALAASLADAQVLQFGEVQKMAPAPYDTRLPYGSDPQ